MDDIRLRPHAARTIYARLLERSGGVVSDEDMKAIRHLIDLECPPTEEELDRFLKATFPKTSEHTMQPPQPFGRFQHIVRSPNIPTRMLEHVYQVARRTRGYRPERGRYYDVGLLKSLLSHEAASKELWVRFTQDLAENPEDDGLFTTFQDMKQHEGFIQTREVAEILVQESREMAHLWTVLRKGPPEMVRTAFLRIREQLPEAALELLSPDGPEDPEVQQRLIEQLQQEDLLFFFDHDQAQVRQMALLVLPRLLEQQNWKDFSQPSPHQVPEQAESKDRDKQTEMPAQPGPPKMKWDGPETI